jgi:F420-non-reducing hydrogenase small subunit
MSGKARLAMYWAASCGGCDVAVINLHERILDVAAAVEIVFWPAVMDAKYRDVEAMPDGSIDVCLFSGGIRSSENEEIAHLLRRKSKVLVAFGSCANEGCIPGLANLSTLSAIFAASYADGESTVNPDGARPLTTWAAPEGELRLPTFLPVLRTLGQVVPVDYSIPGCPPESPRIAEAVMALLAGLAGAGPLPPAGSIVGAGVSTVCDECARTRNVKKISRFVRVQEVAAFDPALCLLEQGIPCNGPATRDGCGALCPAAGAQCVGCYGAADGVVDYGARLMSAFASVVDADEPAEIDRILDGIVDPVGQLYRFSLAGSLLRASRATLETDRTGPPPAPEASASGAPPDASAAAVSPEPALAGARGR